MRLDIPLVLSNFPGAGRRSGVTKSNQLAVEVQRNVFCDKLSVDGCNVRESIAPSKKGRREEAKEHSAEIITLDMKKPLTPARARKAALLNQVGSPGLGSLLCGRWVEGTGQFILCLLSCALVFVWFWKEMSAYYGMMFATTTPVQPSMNMLKVGTVVFIISWLWSGVTSLSLIREASNQSVGTLKNTLAPPALKMDPQKIVIALASIPDWTRNGDMISRTYQFKDFPAAMKFVNAIAETAEQAWHHPDIDIRWNKVTLALTTHSSGGLTEKDFALAKKADELSRA
jgi:4a-hydroxytetrahydrobiopterin dehydratase